MVQWLVVGFLLVVVLVWIAAGFILLDAFVTSWRYRSGR